MQRHLAFACFLPVLYLVATPLAAQQNLFNVPNGDITDEGKFFFQEQVNISSSTVQSNTTLDYGLPHDFEIGMNLFFMNFAANAPLRAQTNSTNDTTSAAPLLLANAQKGFHAKPWLQFSVGAQAGANLADAAHISFAYLGYGTMILREPATGISLHTGVYHGNIAYNGSGDGFLMGGTEIPVFRNKFHLVADFIQGSHANAVFVPGMLYYISERIILSAGWQKPFPGSATEQAVVFELSLL